MTDLVMGLIIGFVVGSALLSVLLFLAVKRVRAGLADRLAGQTEAIADLRRELAEDKETNRHLRHQIHSLTAGSGDLGVIDPITEGVMDTVMDTDVAPAGDIDTVLSERDAARQELAQVQRSLESVRARLEDREAKLREYREAVKEIRLSLESQDRLRGIISITQDVPAESS